MYEQLRLNYFAKTPNIVRHVLCHYVAVRVNNIIHAETIIYVRM